MVQPRLSAPTAGRPRRWTSRTGGALLVLGIAGGLAGCGRPQDTPPPLSLSLDLPADTSFRLPEAMPPDLLEAGLTSGDGIALIDFYSRNERIVTVCQAAREACQQVSPNAEVIPRADAGDGVTVLINATEPGAALVLSDELRRFWSEVRLVVGRPAWLGPGDGPTQS